MNQLMGSLIDLSFSVYITACNDMVNGIICKEVEFMTQVLRQPF